MDSCKMPPHVIRLGRSERAALHEVLAGLARRQQPAGPRCAHSLARPRSPQSVPLACAANS
eukprot:2247189-Alexandrium_andersonii.AAC.1